MTRLIAVYFIIDCTTLRKIHTLQHQDFGSTRQIKDDQSATEMSRRRKHEHCARNGVKRDLTRKTHFLGKLRLFIRKQHGFILMQTAPLHVWCMY